MKSLIPLVWLLAAAPVYAQSLAGQRSRVVRPPPAGTAAVVNRPAPPPPVQFTVEAHTDAGRAVSKVIPPEGGSVSAVAADGTQFTLTIPAGALVSEEEITLTPVTAIDRLPLSGGLSAAVQLAPDGLLLFQAATLVIDLPVPISADQEITFAWRGTGEEFFLYPPKPLNTPSITLTLTHFSGYGAGRGTSADETAQLARVPANADDALAQELQETAAAERKDARSSSGLAPIAAASIGRDTQTSLLDAAKKTLSDYFLKVLHSRQPTRCSDDWEGFLSDLKQFEAQVNELAAGDATLLQAARAYFDSLFSLLAGCYDKDYEVCKSSLDPRQAIEMYRIYQVLKTEKASVTLDRGKIPGCLTFRLEFTSFIQERVFPGLGIGFTHRVSANVPGVVLSPFSTDAPKPVSADLNYDIHSYVGKLAGSGCVIATDGSGDTFKVLEVTAQFNAFYQDKAPIHWLTMKYDPGTPVFIFVLNCEQTPLQTVKAPRWRQIYNALRGDFSGTLTADSWTQITTFGTFAVQKYEAPPDTLQSDEISVLTLKHTPQ